MTGFSLLPLMILAGPMVQDMPAPAPEAPPSAPPATELCDPESQPHNQSVEACQLNTTAKEEAEDLDNQVIEGRERPGFNTSLPDRVDQNNPGAVRAPLALFAQARALGVPLVAIGGITLHNAPQVLAAGADCLAVISDLFDAPDVGARARQYGRLIDEAE